MSRSKAYAVFFTLLFFGSIGQTLYYTFSLPESREASNIILLIVSVVVNILLLLLAIRFWRRTFHEDK